MTSRDKANALAKASMKLRVLARHNGYFTDQMAWDSLSGLLPSFGRAEVNSIKRQARRELDANGDRNIVERP